jgi:hypothetical protein
MHGSRGQADRPSHLGFEFSAVSRGTSVALRVPGKPAAGKTTAALTSDVCNPCKLLHQTWIELGISRGENTVGRVDSSLCNTLRTTDDTCNLFATTRANVSIVPKLL